MISIAELRSQVGEKDPQPLTPGKTFENQMFEGFYAGKILAKTKDFVAIWSRMAARVAIVPTNGIKKIPNIGSIVAIYSWDSHVRGCVLLSSTYDWLDAFDDFSVTFQKNLSTDHLLKANLSKNVFPLNTRGHVAGWIRDERPLRYRTKAKYTEHSSEAS
jgi:hypothetical protein